MKIGDEVDVTIAGQRVAGAKVTELGDGTVTLIVPARRVVMAVRTEIAPEVTAPASETETIIDGVDRVDGEGNVIPPVEPAPAGEVAVGSENVTTPEVQSNVPATPEEVVTAPPATATTVEVNDGSGTSTES